MRWRRCARCAASEDRYRALAENATDLIVEVDADGNFLYVSPNAVELIGFESNELVGNHIEMILRSEHIEDEDRDLLLGGFRRRVGEQGVGGRRIYRIYRKDGVPALVRESRPGRTRRSKARRTRSSSRAT